MTRLPRRASGRASRRLRPLAIVGILMALAGCGETARVEVPAELPLRTNDQLFTIEWALQRDATLVRGVGRITASIDGEATLTLVLFGLDAGGRVVSHGTTYLRSDFASRWTPFTVTLTSKGREETFELRVLSYHIPGLRMS
jgi:hypothetical protein